MTAAGLPADDEDGLVSIGAVVAQLLSEFPDTSVSKIRFLESEGLVTPRRTPSGYRKYSADDIRRLRFVLAAQRDHYLPLKVIKDQLDALDRGLEPDGGGPAKLPRMVAVAADQPVPEFESRPAVRMTRTELLADAGFDNHTLRELEQFGLLQAGPGGYYDADNALLARTVAALISVGMEPRHLRQFRTAADREATLIGQLVSAQARQKNPEARERAEEQATELASTLMRLHALLMKGGIKRELGN